ncbi:MAG TPA: putative Ig domain-containing protein [Nitrospira sp.]|nr:putative Ig domain-containing protein [Nitrospira sp.]
MTVQRGQGQALTLFLPYAATQGGENIALRLQGNEAQDFQFITSDGQLVPDANGNITITVPEGEQQYTFNLLATNDANTNSSLSLSATPVDQNGQPTHISRLEATVQLNANAQTNQFPSLSYPIVGGTTNIPGFGGFGANTDFPGQFPLGTVDGRGNVNYNIVAPPAEWHLEAAAGNDTIVASNTYSFVGGGGGHDTLRGGNGGNVLMGDWRDDGMGVDISSLPRAGGIPDGQDYLVGGTGADVMGGGGGNDVLLGGDGNDQLSGDALVEGPLYTNGQGNPAILAVGSYVGVVAAAGTQAFLGVLHPGNDFLDGGAGNDLLTGDGGNDVVYGGTGDDFLNGDTPEPLNSQLLYPQAPGNDFLDGGSGNDVLFGQGGNDTLLGGDGNDVLDGDAGTDVLQGGAGSDVYRFQLGDGSDTIIDSAAPGDTNSIMFQTGISLSGLTLSQDPVAHSLVIGYGNQGDTITLKNFDPNGTFGTSVIQNIVVGDWKNNPNAVGQGFTLASLLPPLSGFVDGTNASNVFADNTITTGPTDDFIEGGPSGMTLNSGGGNDTIYGGNANDIVHGGTGNNSLFGGAGDDQVYGEGSSDTIDGGAGNDRLIGRTGGTYTYLFGLDGGQDVINGSLGGNYVVQLTGDIRPSDVSVARSGEDLTLHFGSGASLTLQSLASNSSLLVKLPDGTVWTQTTLPLPGGVVNGTANNDIIRTGATNDLVTADGGNDYVDSGPGNDTVYGGDGNDAIQGGTGNNQLFGGAGDDDITAQGANDTIDGGLGNDRLSGTGGGTYTVLFGLGAGQDRIDPSLGGNYVVQLSAGITPSDVTVTHSGFSGTDLTLTLAGGQDTLVLQSFYEHPSFQVKFTDGTVWDQNVLHAQASAAQTGTDGSDTLTGYRGFPNTLVGGGGDDSYVVNNSTDVVVEEVGGGNDTVVSTVDYTLPANVENLGLTNNVVFDRLGAAIYLPSQPTRATGNELNNILNANNLNDVLDGRLGDDTLVAGYLTRFDPISTSADDTLIGGPGNDTYVYDSVYGGIVTIVDDTSNGDTNTLRTYNTIDYGDSAQMHLALEDSALKIVFSYQDSSAGENTHEIVIPNFDPGDAYRATAINQMTFGDTEVTYQQLIALGISIQSTSPDRLVTGTNADDRITGKPGDTLSGGAGTDTYLFNPAAGAETITDAAVPNAMNGITFGIGIGPGDLSFVQSQNTLSIHVGSTTDVLSLAQFDPSGVSGSQVIETLNFAGDLHVSLNDLLLPNGDPTANAIIQGTQDADRIQIKGDNDTVLTGAGDDTVIGGPGHIQLSGGDGNDHLAAGSGDGSIEGDAGNDTLYAGSGTDTLVGGLGDDVLEGGSGGETLIGGLGDDVLNGGSADTTYAFNRGDGHDVIHTLAGAAEKSHLLFGPGISLSDLSLYTWDSQASLDASTIIGIAIGNDNFIELPNVVGQAATITTATFDDGTTVNLFDYYRASQIQTDQLLVSTTPNQTLIGGAGNNTLVGGAGNSVLIAGGGRNNTMIGGSGHTTFISGGTVQSAASNNVFVPGAGGNTYLINSGSSINTIAFPNTNVPLPLPNNVQFGGGYNSFNPRLGVGSLDIHYGTSGGELIIEGFDPNNAERNPGIDTFEFTDRTLTYDQFLALGFDIQATGPGQEINGTSVMDRLVGTQGNDTLNGGAGNDSLTGGPDDVLIGGCGDDTYIFNAGDGQQLIQDTSRTGEGNRIQFGTGITQSDLTFIQDQAARTLTIQVGASGADRIILKNFDPTNANGSLVVQTFAFADGSATDLASLFGAPTNHAPTIEQPLADQTVPEDTPFTVQVPANTFADQDAGDTLIYSASLANGDALPAWVSFNAVIHTFSGTPDDAQVGSLDLRVTATDIGALTASEVFTLTVTDVNEAPTVTNALADQQATEKSPFSVAVPSGTFADQDSVHGDQLTYSATLADGSPLPAWLSFDVNTRTLSGTPSNADVGMLSMAMHAADLAGLTATDSFALTVLNVNDAPTVAMPFADQTVPEDAPFSIQVPTSTFADEDAIHGDTLTYSASLVNGTALPSWLSFSATTRTFTATPDDAQIGSLDLRVTATDTGNLSASDVFTLTVTNVNEAPIVANPLVDQSVQAGQTFTFTVPPTAFRDVDPGDTLTYSSTLANGNALPAWLSFNRAARTFSGTPGNADVGTLSVKVIATDTGSLSAADDFMLTISSADQTLTGTPGNDVLTGGIGNDQLLGLAGNDTLVGGAGNDLVDGGPGVDNMQGGAGNDTYIVENTGDVVTENPSEGIDMVQSSITYTLGANVESLTLTGTMAINGTGNSLDNVLIGNSSNNSLTGGPGNDRLDGGLGNDTMAGGTGNDTYVVNQAGDVVSENANEGTDAVESSVTYTLGSNVENLTLTGTANINGTGGSANNSLIGNSGNNQLDGGSGNDTVDGGAGDDSLLGGSGDDQLLGGVGNDTVSAGSGNDVLNGGDGTDILDAGSGDDQLFGGAGNDQLSGGSGADQFTGGIGNDTLAGGSGNDRYTFARGDGQDTILDSDSSSGNQDHILFGATINPLDLVLRRQVNDLRLSVHGSNDSITIQNWYTSPAVNQIEDIQAGNGQHLINTQVDQLIQAMAGFTQQSGLTWDQAIDQRPQQVQAVLAANWH